MVYTCIVCPKSCRVSIEEGREDFVLSGHACIRGKNHAVAEHTRPMRMITTTVKIKDGSLMRLPIISTREIPKDMVDQCLDIIYNKEVVAPVKEGDVLIENICGSGVDIVASRNINIKKIN